MSKLTNDQLLAIQQDWRTGKPYRGKIKDLARKHGLHRHTIERALTRPPSVSLGDDKTPGQRGGILITWDNILETYLCTSCATRGMIVFTDTGMTCETCSNSYDTIEFWSISTQSYRYAVVKDRAAALRGEAA